MIVRKSIAQAIPKSQYYYQSRSGNRLFELGLSPLALTIVGSSSKEDLNAMDAILADQGASAFAQAFLAQKGIPNPFIGGRYEEA
jgi:type IV secretory pathway VirB4 component